MYTLMIVDDELSSRQGLCQCFPWHEHGINIIAQAKDGLEAKKILASQKPDIILTDVRMPRMDGIKLSRYVRKEHKNIKIVFISGYDDLNYIKAAIKLDATDYIIKPIDFTELNEVLLKIIHELDTERQYNQHITNINKKIDLSIPMLKDKLFLDLLLKDGCHKDTLRSILEITEMRITDQTNFCILIISLDKEFDMLQSGSKERFLTSQQSLLAVCKSYSYSSDCSKLIHNIHFLETANGDTVGILYPPSVHAMSNIMEFANDIRKYISINLNITVTVAVSEIKTGILALHRLYQHAVMTLERRLTLGGNKVIQYENIDKIPQRTAITLKWEKNLDKILASSDKAKFDQFLKEFWDDILLKGPLNLSIVHQVCNEIFFMSRRYLHGLQILDLDMELNQMENCILEMDTINGIKKHLSHYFMMISSHVQEQIRDPSTITVKQICNIIHERYADNLTVQSIAEQIYLAVPYVCTIFKRKMGLTINEYLTKTRIENSKTLLKDSRYKLYEVSKAIGYQDPTYFTRQFKKYTGYTPNEFRSILLTNNSTNSIHQRS